MMTKKANIQLSKAGLRFINRIDYFDEDIEFVELLCKDINLILPAHDDKLLFAGISADNEPMLSRKQVCRKSRELVVTHLRTTVYTAFIKEIYEEVTEYLKILLEETALISQTKEKAHTLIGEKNRQITFSATELLQYSDIQELHIRIANDLMRQLEKERSTIKLIKSICSRLNITINKSTIDNALPYLELRHILVHLDGKPDESFLHKYENIFKKRYNNSRIHLDRQLAMNAKSKISTMIKEIDREAVTKGIMRENTAK